MVSHYEKLRLPRGRWLPKRKSVALEDVLTSTKWGGQPFPGKHATTFAKKFAELHTAKYAQCVNTGTVAIQASLIAIGIRPGTK